MASKYDEGPEVAPQQAYPEVYHPPPQPHPTAPQPISVTPYKPEDSTYGAYPATAVDQSVYAGTPHDYRSTYHVPGGEPNTPQRGKKTVCGCSFLVFLLSVIIAILATAVVGLAAGTGVGASRANNALERLAAMEASATQASATVTVTTTSPSSTATSFASISNNCSNEDETTTGQTYTTAFFGKVTFTMYCNTNAPHPPLMSLFTANFNNCMDACASFSSYEKGFNGNATCTGVSFIPLWTTRQGAIAGKAPGNCYLKPGTQTQAGLETPNIGTECHAAILKTT